MHTHAIQHIFRNTHVVILSPPPFLLGSLRVKVQEWLLGCGKIHCTVKCLNTESKLLKSLQNFLSRFASPDYMGNALATYGDEDLDAWESEARRWARVLFLAINDESHLIPIWTVCLSFLSHIFFLALIVSLLCKSSGI